MGFFYNLVVSLGFSTLNSETPASKFLLRFVAMHLGPYLSFDGQQKVK